MSARGGLPILLAALVVALAGAEAQERPRAGDAVDGVVAASGDLPVLVVPGWGDGVAQIAPLRQRFLDAGWEPADVSAMTFRDPVGSNEANAREVAREVEALRRLSGSAQVDIVAHSMGGLAVRRYLATPEARRNVRRAVFLATPHRGTLAAVLAWGDGGREMVPGSEFLTRLNGERGLPEEVEILSIRSPFDLRVIPGSSAMLPGARNLEICCPSHHGILDDEKTFDEIQRFLRYGGKELTSPDGTIPLRTEPRHWAEIRWNR